MNTTDKPKAFKPVNIAASDWDKYNQAALTLSAKRGKRVSIPALLNEAFTQYKESL